MKILRKKEGTTKAVNFLCYRNLCWSYVQWEDLTTSIELKKL